MATKRIRNLTAIDFGAYNLKLVNGTVEPNQLVLDKATKIPIPEGIYEDGQIRKSDQLRDTLKPVIQENHLAGTATIGTIESSLTVVRELSLPLVKPKEMKELISFEIQNYLPIELNQYVIQSKLISEYQEGNARYANVIVAALPKEIAETHLSLMEELGLKPMALDIHSNCQAKLLDGIGEKHNPFKDKTIILADIGHCQTNLTLIEKGYFRFNRLLNIGGIDLDRNLANFLGIPEIEARILKTQLPDLNFAPDDATEDARAHNIAVSTVDSWLDEVERIFKFYTSRNTGNHIDHILLLGGSSHLRGLDQYIQQATGIPAQFFNHTEGIRIPKNLSALDLSHYANAIGAMIRLV